MLGGVTIAESATALRVLETSHPPGIYIPPQDIAADVLAHSPTVTMCEWKGLATYWDATAGGRSVAAAGWSYPNPTAAFAALADHVSFYPGRVDACFLDDEQVVAQAGDFYGGWITGEIVGPFKGASGTWGW